MVENGVSWCGLQQTSNHRPDTKKHIIQGTFEIEHSPWSSLCDVARSLAIRIYSSQKKDPSTAKGLESENADMMKGKVLSREKTPIMKSKLSVPMRIIKFSFKFQVVPEFGPPGAFVMENRDKHEFFLKSATLQYIFPVASNKKEFHFYCNSWVYPLEKTRVKRVFFVNELYLPNETPPGLVELRRKELQKLRGGSNDERKPWDRIYEYDKYNDLGDPDNGREYARLVLGGSTEFPYPRRLRTGRPRCYNDPLSESRPASCFQSYVPPDEQMSHDKQEELKNNFVDALVRFLTPKQNQRPGSYQELPDFIQKIVHFFVPTAALTTEDCKLIPSLVNFFKRKPESSSHQETCSFDSIDDMYDIFAEKEVNEMEEWVKQKLKKFVPDEIFNEVVATAATKRNLVNSQLPSIIAEERKAWEEDKDFGRQLLAGTNPVRVERVKGFSPEMTKFWELMKENMWKPIEEEIWVSMKEEFSKESTKEDFSKELMKENFLEESMKEESEGSMKEESLELMKEKTWKSMKNEIWKSMKENISKESMKQNFSAKSMKEKFLEETMKEKFSEELMKQKFLEVSMEEEKHFEADFFQDIQKDITEKNLFVLEHHDYLQPFLKMINGTGVCAYATRTLLFNRSNRIEPIAIQLSLPDSKNSMLVFQDDGFRWKLAKFHVAANDAAYHQLVSHWLHTHAIIEPFIIATRRQLSMIHPIHRLLDPHFKDTLHINALARGMFLNAGGILERTLFTGEVSMQLSSKLYKKWRFDEQALPSDLVKRGMAVKAEEMRDENVSQSKEKQAEQKPDKTSDKKPVERDVKAEESPSDENVPQFMEMPAEPNPGEIADKNPVKKDKNPEMTLPAGVKLILKDYPYAKDGIEIWDAIEKWVREYCNIFYIPNYDVEEDDRLKEADRVKKDEKVKEDGRAKADERVREDKEIKEWWSEIRNEGHGDQNQGWYDLKTLEELIKALTTIIWITSGLHAAVNFGQYAYAGWPLNRPMLLRKFIPEPGTEELKEAECNSGEFIAHTMPEKFQTEFFIAIMDLLSRHTSDEVYLGQGPPEYTWDERETVNKKIEVIRKRFGKSLEKIEENIKERNKNYQLMNRWGYAKVPYKLLYPDTKTKAPSKENGIPEKMDITGRGIPNSISI